MYPLSQLSRSQGLVVFGAGHPRRAEVERFIYDRFAAEYGADVSYFLPRLLGLLDDRGDIRAAVGLRAAEKEPFFLEQYLLSPVHELLAQRTGQAIDRVRLLEIGNLACRNQGTARLLIPLLARELLQGPHQWIVCTMLPVLANAFKRLGLDLVDLGPADPKRLPPNERERWGSYYLRQPRVMAGRIAGAEAMLQAATAVLGDAA